eukprot:scaffold2189_cov116-Cylindrotheca_fusiformis.AAC.14
MRPLVRPYTIHLFPSRRWWLQPHHSSVSILSHMVLENAGPMIKHYRSSGCIDPPAFPVLARDWIVDKTL